MEKNIKTPFELAVEQVKSKSLETPAVSYQGKEYLEKVVIQYDDDEKEGDKIWGFKLIFRIKTVLNLAS